jgi:hypothetical protein
MTQRKRESPHTHTQSGITLELLPNHDFFLPNEKKKKKSNKNHCDYNNNRDFHEAFPFFFIFLKSNKL